MNNKFGGIALTKFKVSEYYIAYFDILGYKAFFEDKESDLSELLESIVAISQDVVKTTSLEGAFNDKFLIKAFSDNFIVLLEDHNISEYQAIKSLSYLLALLQLRFLEKYSILLRGSITKGYAYINKSIVFGEGLVRSVELEGMADFPRIIIDDLRISREVCSDLCEKSLLQDNDEKYYVDFFDVLDKRVGDDDFFGENEKEHLFRIRTNIVKLTNRYGKYNRLVKDNKKIIQTERTISKYLWLLTKFNNFCIYQYQDFVINYNFVLYQRLMKSEIHVNKERIDHDY